MVEVLQDYFFDDVIEFGEHSQFWKRLDLDAADFFCQELFRERQESSGSNKENEGRTLYIYIFIKIFSEPFPEFDFLTLK